MLNSTELLGYRSTLIAANTWELRLGVGIVLK